MDQLRNMIILPKLWVSIVFTAICVALWFMLRRYIHRVLDSGHIQGKKGLNTKFAATIIQYVFIAFAVIVVLQINGVDVSSLATGLGIGGIVIGFALQDFLKDVIMGINIVWDQYFSLDDVVKYGEIEGRVVDFNIKVTKIRDIKTGNLVTISNRNISEIEILSDWQILRIPGPYSEPAERMRQVCAIICERVTSLDGVTGCTFQGTEAFEDSQIIYRLLMHCPPERGHQLRRDAYGIVQDVLAEQGIAIPYPQLDVHMDR